MPTENAVIRNSIASLLFGAGIIFAGKALANDAAIEPAMDACSTGGNYSEQEKHACEVHALAMQRSMQAARDRSEGVIYLDFDDSNDTEAQKAAKISLSNALQACEDAGEVGGPLETCRLEGFLLYEQAIGQ